MSGTSFLHRSSLVAAATAIAAGGLIAASAPAQAMPNVPQAPGCGQWNFPGQTTFQLSSGEFVSFNSTGPNAGGPSQWNTTNGSPPHQGTVSGGINASGGVQVQFHDTKGSTDTFAGQVGPDGSASGNISGGPAGLTWSTAAPMNCAPKEGPTVSWDPIIGGLVAHIGDRSGVSSQCTYTSDFYTRSFPLQANSTFDLKIIPAIPKFQNWNVTIKCDNGTETHTTTFF